MMVSILKGGAMKRQEYEVISHNPMHFTLFLMHVLYRSPHLHRDFEIACVLEGSVTVTCAGQSFAVSEGELFIVNPFEVHELEAAQPALLLFLQVAPDFFAGYYPEVESLLFDQCAIRSTDAVCTYCLGNLVQTADCFFRQPDLYEMVCVTAINALFLHLFSRLPHHRLTPSEQSVRLSRGGRMSEFLDYIDAHASEKLLLSDLAKDRHVSMYHLSHRFREEYGMSFQEYLSRTRCEKARQQLLLTDRPLLDIAIGCGFSDPKYFNRDFAARYGCSPKEYRKRMRGESLPDQQRSILTAQEHLSAESAVVFLDRYRERLPYVWENEVLI